MDLTKAFDTHLIKVNCVKAKSYPCVPFFGANACGIAKLPLTADGPMKIMSITGQFFCIV